MTTRWKPELDIISVPGLECVGVPIGTPELVNTFVRSKAHATEQDVQKLRIVQDPKIHYDLLRFCQHTRLAFLARNVLNCARHSSTGSRSHFRHPVTT